MKYHISNSAITRWLIFIGAVAVVYMLLPREESSKYTYEVNRPWADQLLTAPFDIPVYLDTVRAQAIKDSIDSNFEPVFYRDAVLERARLDTFSIRLREGVPGLSQGSRLALVAEVKSIFDNGLVDSETYSAIRQGALKRVRILSDNVAVSVPASQFKSVRTAYVIIDSVARDILHNDAAIAPMITEALAPNICPDSTETERFRNEAYQSALAPVGVVQQGERIIDRGDIVTPQLYTILRTYEKLAADRGAAVSSDRYYFATGRVLYIVLLFAAMYVYLWFYRRDYYYDIKRVLFLMLCVTAFGAAALLTASSSLGLYVVPFTIVPITVLVFLDSRTAFFAYMVTILLSVLVANFPLEFMVLEFAAGLTATVSIKDLTRRSQLLLSAVLVFAVSSLSYIVIELMQTGTLQRLSPATFGGFAINAVLISFAYVLIFIFEKIFGFTSRVTLVELSDINNPVLRELSEECPGTFQHSMAVSTLATAAARKIGANVQLVRAGALYHDIGKLSNPAFFTENQHGVNPHDGLDPRQSAAIVIGHVPEGLRRAEKAKLPERLRDFIAEHHGAGKARYFYTTYCNAHPDEDVDPAPFTYPGPNPRSRETSILMMADAVEAASRSLKDYSPESIKALVDRLIDSQIADGLHNDSSISFRDVQDIKESFVSRLRTLYHSRVSYPEDTRPKKAE
ncbi:MAG: HDIG domain-containing protein [Muribaculaceae bacterium]|nr:HDIG domain-containing protein [Muribaculaceae bacterium]